MHLRKRTAFVGFDNRAGSEAYYFSYSGKNLAYKKLEATGFL
ncbi:hypothetical protein [Fischerella thermalis]|nr:hypothetical protein [Fischerella thermalis]